MNKLTGILAAASAAALSLYSANAIAQETRENESRIEHRQHRLEHPFMQQDGEPDFLTLMPTFGLYQGIEGVELNHQLIGYGVGAELTIHIGVGSAPLNEDERFYFGIEVDNSVVPLITGGLYDGFVAQHGIGFSGMLLNPDVCGGFYAGVGIDLVNTIDPWQNEFMGVYGNAHVGGRLSAADIFNLEFEAGALFSETDSGFYTTIGIGVALPGVSE